MVTLKSIGLSYSLSGSFMHIWFLISWMSHLEDVIRSYAVLPTSKYFIIRYQKSYSLILPPVSSEKPSCIGKLSNLQWQIHSFQNYIFSLKILPLGRNVISYFPRSYKLIYIIFNKMSAKYQSLSNHSLSVSCSLIKKMVFHKRKQLVWLSTQSRKESPFC